MKTLEKTQLRNPTDAEGEVVQYFSKGSMKEDEIPYVKSLSISK